MIEELKASIAKEKIEEFLESMKKIGFQDDEILSMMNKTMNGGKS